jgi:ATP-dependent DNA helicase RecQ
MCGYAAGSACRRAYVLRYFGSAEARERCEACDRCLGLGHAMPRDLDETERKVVRIALSGVARVNDRFGRSRLAQFLSGKTSREVTEAGLDRLPTHGKLSHVPLRTIGDLLEALADEGLLSRRALDGPGSGAILSITDEGRRVMIEDPPVRLAIPDLGVAPARTKTGRAKSRTHAAPAAASGTPADPALARTLRLWRLREAKKRGVPAYAVFHDSTLDALAAMRPRTEAELAAVPGIGPGRIAKFGGELLHVLAHGTAPEETT